MGYKKSRARIEDPTRVSSRATGSGDDGVPQGAGGVLGRAPELVPPELIVFVATDDFGCAQVAMAWFQMLADPRKARAVLASRRGDARVSPEVVRALRESGADLQTVHARPLTSDLLTSADLVVTMGGSFERGGLGGGTPPLRREHWLIPNLEGDLDLDRARNVREVIRSRVAMLAFSEGWGRADISRDAARVTRPRRSSEFLAIV